MWIRSQDEKRLIDANKVYICKLRNGKYGLYISDYVTFLIGKYSTEEKALKVLDMIQKYVVFNSYEVFLIPQDDEVEV